MTSDSRATMGLACSKNSKIKIQFIINFRIWDKLKVISFVNRWGHFSSLLVATLLPDVITSLRRRQIKRNNNSKKK